MDALLDHFHHKLCDAGFTLVEVIALRAYTGPLYVKMNSALRQSSGRFGTVQHLQGNKYINLIYATVSCMRKISRVSAIPVGRKVWRGLGGVKVPKEFSVLKEGRGLGGVDYGFASTSGNQKVPITYILIKTEKEALVACCSEKRLSWPSVATWTRERKRFGWSLMPT
jgi:hypothetical protein